MYFMLYTRDNNSNDRTFANESIEIQIVSNTT
jgi:hypothetical protein